MPLCPHFRESRRRPSLIHPHPLVHPVDVQLLVPACKMFPWIMVFATKKKIRDLNGRKMSRNLGLKIIKIVGTKRIGPDQVVRIVDPIVIFQNNPRKFRGIRRRFQNNLKPLQNSLNIFRDDLIVLHDDLLVQSDDLRERFKEPREMKNSRHK